VSTSTGQVSQFPREVIEDIFFEILHNLAGYDYELAKAYAQAAVASLQTRHVRSHTKGVVIIELIKRLVSQPALEAAGYLIYKEEIWRNQIRMRRQARAGDSPTSSKNS
jgi:hypothetical protein